MEVVEELLSTTYPDTALEVVEELLSTTYPDTALEVVEELLSTTYPDTALEVVEELLAVHRGGHEDQLQVRTPLQHIPDNILNFS